MPPGPRPRAILLLTDGLQNVPPWIQDVGPTLAGTDVHAIGYGTAASLDGAGADPARPGPWRPLHAGDRPLALRKFFALAFGNMFEAGSLLDPSGTLQSGQDVSDPVPFDVSDEDSVTVVLGWEPDEAGLRLRITTPSGQAVQPGAAGVEADAGALVGLRAGRAATQRRARGCMDGRGDPAERGVRARDRGALRPATSSTCSPPAARGSGTCRARAGSTPAIPSTRWSCCAATTSSTPHGATVACTVTRPAVAAGDVLAQRGLGGPRTIDGDTIPARQATLLDIEQQSGTPPVGYEQVSFELLADPARTPRGSSRATGSSAECSTTSSRSRTGGDYTFHCRATYGHDHPGAREHVWTLHVDTGIDAAQTGIDVVRGAAQPGGDTRVRITLTPRDRYGHLLGPGRADAISVAGTPGTTVIGLPADNGDGTYTVNGEVGPGERPSSRGLWCNSPTAPERRSAGGGGGARCLAQALLVVGARRARPRRDRQSCSW